MSTETITVEQFIAQPKARVWEALTTPEQIEKWWAPGDIAPVVGHQFTMDMGPFGDVQCRVLEANPPDRLVYTFADWTLTWILVERDGGTLLRLEHSGFDLENPQHKFAFDKMGPGWRSAVLPRLASFLVE